MVVFTVAVSEKDRGIHNKNSSGLGSGNMQRNKKGRTS